MKKIPTVFQRNVGAWLVKDTVTPGSEWVLNNEGIATRKWDGSACLIQGGILYKRFTVQLPDEAPVSFIPAENPNVNNGKWPGWIIVEPNDEANQWHIEAFLASKYSTPDGTYELCGPKVNGNPEKLESHVLIKHGDDMVMAPRTFEGLKDWFQDQDIEGVVWHHEDGRMAKIKKKDFGYER